MKMTHTIKYALLIFLFIHPSLLWSQVQKIGYIESEVILEKIPEYKNIDKTLEILAQGWYEEIDKMEKQLAQLQQNIETQNVLYTSDFLREKEKEVDDLNKKIIKYKNDKFGTEGQYYKELNTLLLPIQKRISEAVYKVAQNERYNYIFDRSNAEFVFFADPEHDLTNKVLKALNIN